MPDTPAPIPVDDQGFATGPVPDGIYGEDRQHWADFRVYYEDNDDLPPPHDIATFIEITLHNAVTHGHGPFPGNLVERERIADTIRVGVGDTGPIEGVALGEALGD